MTGRAPGRRPRSRARCTPARTPSLRAGCSAGPRDRTAARTRRPRRDTGARRGPPPVNTTRSSSPARFTCARSAAWRSSRSARLSPTRKRRESRSRAHAQRERFDEPVDPLQRAEMAGVDDRELVVVDTEIGRVRRDARRRRADGSRRDRRASGSRATLSIPTAVSSSRNAGVSATCIDALHHRAAGTRAPAREPDAVSARARRWRRRARPSTSPCGRPRPASQALITKSGYMITCTTSIERR